MSDQSEQVGNAHPLAVGGDPDKLASPGPPPRDNNLESNSGQPTSESYFYGNVPGSNAAPSSAGTPPKTPPGYRSVITSSRHSCCEEINIPQNIKSTTLTSAFIRKGLTSVLRNPHTRKLDNHGPQRVNNDPKLGRRPNPWRPKRKPVPGLYLSGPKLIVDELDAVSLRGKPPPEETTKRSPDKYRTSSTHPDYVCKAMMSGSGYKPPIPPKGTCAVTFKGMTKLFRFYWQTKFMAEAHIESYVLKPLDNTMLSIPPGAVWRAKLKSYHKVMTMSDIMGFPVRNKVGDPKSGYSSRLTIPKLYGYNCAIAGNRDVLEISCEHNGKMTVGNVTDWEDAHIIIDEYVRKFVKCNSNEDLYKACMTAFY